MRPPRHLWQQLVTVSPQEQQKQQTTAIVDRDAGPTNDNDNTDEDDERVIFRERLLARSFEDCCRTTLQRLRGSTNTTSPTTTLNSDALLEGQIQEGGTAEEEEEDLENQPVAVSVSVSVGSVGDSTTTWSDVGSSGG